MLRTARILAVVLAAAACATEPAGDGRTLQLGIAGGQPVAAGAWPTVVWLDNGCTGVLLAADLVVYSAHCGEDVTNVWAGDHVDVIVDEASGSVAVADGSASSAHAVSYCHANPEYRIAAGNDIAFCVLDEPVMEGGTLVGTLPLCATDQAKVGSSVTLVGFGYDEAGRDIGTKRSAAAEIVSNGIEVRIGDATRGTCAGDSGSPAFFRTRDREWWLLGLLSTGIHGEVCGAGYYTRMDLVVPWLEQETDRDLSPCISANGTPEPCSAAALDAEGRREPGAARASDVCGSDGSTHLRVTGGCATQRPGGSHAWPVMLMGVLWIMIRVSRSRGVVQPST